jgi:hypothetical protein
MICSIFPSNTPAIEKYAPMLFQGLAGRLLDAGVGTGRNIPF